MLFIQEVLLVYKLETFKNCKEVQLIRIMFIAIIYIFLSYVIFDQQLKITFRKSSVPLSPEKIHSPFYSLPSPKNLKVASSPLFDNIEKFLGCPSSRKGGRTRWLLCRSSSFFSLLLFFVIVLELLSNSYIHGMLWCGPLYTMDDFLGTYIIKVTF